MDVREPGSQPWDGGPKPVLLQDQHLGQGRGSREKGRVFFLDWRSDMEFLEVLTEHLDRVMLVRGGGREVITIYS